MLECRFSAGSTPAPAALAKQVHDTSSIAMNSRQREIEFAIEVFVRGHSAGKSRTFPYEAHRFAPYGSCAMRRARILATIARKNGLPTTSTQTKSMRWREATAAGASL